MNHFTFNSTKSIQFGVGALASIGDLALRHVGSKVMLVTDVGLVATGIVDQAMASLKAAGILVEVFDEVEADPPEKCVLEAVSRAQKSGVAGVIGLGGGSSLDVAKLVALLAPGTEELEEVYGVEKAQGPRLPLVLVPTTAGTGSEVTPISIVTTGENEKLGVVSQIIQPDIALLDPELTFGLPPHVTAATGIDAMVHAIEAYASSSPNNNPISKVLSTQALTLLGRSILTAVREGTNHEARSEMLLGSMLAGLAFANSPVAAVHALAYPLGGHFHIPHGLSNALVLPHVLRFNAETSPQAYAELAPFVFPDLGEAEPDIQAARFCDRLAGLSEKCGLRSSLRAMSIPEDALPMLARDVMGQTRLLANNPRTLTEEDALAIYRAAY